jgi:hypothetical protein
VSAARRSVLERNGFPVPARVTVRAVIDTGSAFTGFDPPVFGQLDLQPVGTREVLTPSTGPRPHEAAEYDVSVSIAHPDLEMHIPRVLAIASVFDPREGVQGMIGRDVLDACVLVYNGLLKTFTLAY